MTHYQKPLYFIIASIIIAGCASSPFSAKPSGDKNRGEARAPGVKRVFVKDIKADLGDKRRIIRIKASAPFKYITYMLKNPRRLAVEISGASSSLSASSMVVVDNVIKHIGVLDFKEARAVRVEIWLTRPMKYDLKQEGSELEISFTPYQEANDPTAMAKRLILTHQNVNRLKTEIENLKAKLTQLQHQYNIDENTIADLMQELSTSSLPSSKAPGSADGKKAVENGAIESQTSEAAEAEKNVDDARAKISELIGRWKSAWQDQDYKTYARFYAGTFSQKEMGLEDWLAIKKEKFRKAKSISVQVANLNITIDGGRATAKFTQHYSSDLYNDTGVKTLILIKTDEGWKIESENWRP